MKENKPLRTCYICGTTAKYPHELYKFKTGTEHKHNKLNLCTKCYNEKYEHRIRFKGKLTQIPKEEYNKLQHATCTKCNKTREQQHNIRISIHHTTYHQDEPLKDTTTLCISCHNKERKHKQ